MDSEQARRFLAEIRVYQERDVLGGYNKGEKRHLIQEEFHRSMKRNRWILGGNRTGKTTGGAVEAVWTARGIHPHRANKPTDGWVVSLSNEVQRDVAQREILHWLHPKWIVDLSVRSGKKDDPENAIIDYIKIKNVFGTTSIIGFKSVDQGREKFQGTKKDWCIAEGQRILMADGGYLPIEDIKEGDHVLSSNGRGDIKKAKVTAIHDNGIKDIVDVNMSRGPWIRMTKDHKVFVGANKKTEVENADKIFQARIGWQPEATCDKNDAYYVWGGLVLSEGSINCKKITMGDESVVDSAIKYLPENAYVRKKEFKNDHVPDWYLNWNDFWDVIGEGLSHEKQVPQWIFRSSNEKIKLFLRFLFAGDGWATGHLIGYASTSRKLAEDVSILLWRIGIRSSVIKKNSQKIGVWRDQWWTMVTSSDHVLEFIDKVGIEGKDLEKVRNEALRRILSKKNRAKNSFLKPKNIISKGYEFYRHKNDMAKERYSSIRSQQDAGKSRVYDLTVETTHRFFVGTSLVSNCWFDEEPPKEIYDECRMRVMDSLGSIWGTMTPLKGLTYIYDMIYLNEPNDPDVVCWTMAWDDNPFLNKDEITLLEATMDEDERESRQYGRFMAKSGLIYKEFKEDIHIIDPFTVPKGWYDKICIDPGYTNPLSCHWYACDNDGNVYSIAEHYRANMLIPDHAEKIWKTSRELEWPTAPNGFLYSLIDSAAAQKTLAAEKSVVDLFAEQQIACDIKVDKDVWTGIQRVKQYLKLYHHKDEVVWPRGKPKLFIFKTCQEQIREFKSYRWAESRIGFNEKEEPRKSKDHCLTGDTLIDTVDGQVPIKDLVGKEGFVHCYDVEKKVSVISEFKDVRKTIENADVYDILLDDGRHFKATATHPILTEKGWRMTKELELTDKIVDIGEIYKGSKSFLD